MQQTRDSKYVKQILVELEGERGKSVRIVRDLIILNDS